LIAGLLALIAVVVPGVVRREHEIAGSEDDVLALHAREVHRTGEPQANGVRRVAMRRHDLDRIVDPVGDIEGRCGGPLRREAGIHQHERAALGGLGLDELRRAQEQRLDLALVLPDEGHGLAALHDLAVLIVRDLAVHHPVRRHVVGVDVAVQFIQRGLK
jgi:hypothetical protein